MKIYMIKFRYLLVCLLICMVGCSAYAASPSLSLTNPDALKYPPLSFKPPQAERVSLNNGMILYFIEDHELPLVNIQAVVKCGSYFDPDGKEGLAEMTGMLMRTGGSEIMSGSSIDETLESLAIDIIISTQMESTTLSFSSLINHLDVGIKILSQIMMQPAFTEGKLQLAKNLKIEELRRIADDPQQLTFREFNRIIYRGSPRGRLASIDTINSIQRSDIVSFYKRLFHPGNILVAITGDINKNEAIALFEKYFGTWQKRGTVEEISPPDTKLLGGIYHLSKDTPQSVIITGKFAPSKNDQDYYPFTVLDFILGSGGFRSRIFQKIRTNQGLAYSAGSFYRARSSYGIFGTYAMTKSATTGKVISLLGSIAEGAKMEAINASELQWAIKSINNSFIFSFRSTEQVARQQLMLEVDNLPSDHLLKYQERIKQTGIKDLIRTVSKYLNSTGTVIMVTGKESDFDKPLADFGKVEKLKIND